MGRKEHPFVWYFDQDSNFAGLINGWLFHGQEYVEPEHLSDTDRRYLTRRGTRAYQERCRDLCKRVEHMEFRLLIGVEEQTYVSHAMPVRVMDYDSASYKTQLDRIRSRHQAAKDLADDEFLAGISKSDRLIPVITLVLYCGVRPWNGPLRLHDLLALDQMLPELRAYVADYRIHVLDICHTSDQRLAEFPPDIRTMFLFFKYQDDPVMLMIKLADSEAVSRDTYDTIADFAGDQQLKRLQPEKKGEKVDMCKAIDMLVADGERRGEERGFQLGAAKEREKIMKKMEQERKRAEAAEARVRELEQLLKN